MALIILTRCFYCRFLTTMVLKSVCEIHVSAKFSSFILLWSRELFGQWRHNWEAKGNAHKVNTGLDDYGAATRKAENYLGLMIKKRLMVPCLRGIMHGFGTEVFKNLAISLADSRDYHLFIYKVYQYNLSMFVPILTSFGIENSSRHNGPRKLLALISLSIFFMTPVFQHGASLVNYEYR